MQTHDHELLQFRFSSAPFEKSGALDAFREAYSRSILRFDVESIDGDPLQFDFVLRSLPDFAVASGSRSPMRIWRTNDLIENDDVLLVVVTRGAGELGQHGRVAAMSNGGAALMENGASASFMVPTSSHTITYRFRRNLLRPHLPNLDDLLIRPIAGESQALRLLIGYSRVLNDQNALVTAELRRTITTHMHGLAVLLLGGKVEAPVVAGLRAARLKALKDDILQGIARSSLSAGEIARTHQISERYIRKLFAEEGTTFTDFVRVSRLDRAHRMLNDRAQARRPINAIAYECGFGDLSYFNRSFRQRYGMTPSDARQLMRQSG